MTRLRLTALLVACLVLVQPLHAQRKKGSKKAPPPEVTRFALGLGSPLALALDTVVPLGKIELRNDGKLPMTKLAPAKAMPHLCLVKYPVTTRSPECQLYFDQGLGFFYSYVWMEAARSFETAAKHDPDCAMAWWGLSKAIEKWGKGQHADALKKAKELLGNASHRESLLIKARLAEKGMLDGVKPEDRRKEAAKHLDELLSLYDDDEEGWFCRAQVADGPKANIPYFKALLRVNPLHPGAHHELVHIYENIRRPALGWPHAVGYIQSSPGLPHAFHMQAHLGMRIGKWGKTTDWSARAIELQKEYHRAMGVKPNEDWQFSHHLETLMLSLTHDGRFKEARDIKRQCEGYKYEHRMPWFRLHVAERDWDEALKVAGRFSKDKATAAYLRAVVYLRKGDYDRAAPEVSVLAEAYPTKKNDKDLQLRLWETQGMLQCAKGASDAGLKLLAKTIEKTKDDYRHHAWGGGAYHMECWGIAALKSNKLAVAEEAFLEALAHDAGSVRGALGMQVVCERQARSEEAIRFAELAQRCWRKADPGRLQVELDDLRTLYWPEPSAATSSGE
jgi:tetratricopeptide (TPR) repeat protein